MTLDDEHHPVVKKALSHMDDDYDEKGRVKDSAKKDKRNWYNDPWGTGFASDKQQ